MGYEERKARLSLTQVPHSNYFVKQLKSSELLQSTYDTVNKCHKVWPLGEIFDTNCDEHIVIEDGERCKCWRRIDYNIQCKHELKLNPKFEVKHWGHRWLNRKEFNRLYPNMSTFEINPEVINVEEDDGHTRNIDNSTNLNGKESSHSVIHLDNDNLNDGVDETICNSIMDEPNSIVTYRDVLEVATDLCRTVSDDPKLCKSTYATISEWITKLRQGDNFEVAFHNKALPHTHNVSRCDNPLAAVITPAGSTKRKRKRYKSSAEIRRNTYTSKRTQ